MFESWLESEPAFCLVQGQIFLDSRADMPGDLMLAFLVRQSFPIMLVCDKTRFDNNGRSLHIVKPIISFAVYRNPFGPEYGIQLLLYELRQQNAVTVVLIKH
jgi:hypothetical protein